MTAVTQRDSYDVIVIGVGGMGSATAYHLARRGLRVLGLERWDVPNAMGSSHGITRIIRLAYFENPAYVPLLRRSYALWRELEREWGGTVLHITGSLDASGETDTIFRGSLSCCEANDIPHEVLDADDVARRFPAYRLPAGHRAVLQPDGGFLEPERCIVAHVEAAQAHGAEIRARERVLAWDAGGDGVTVETEHGRYHGARLVVCAGAWAPSLVPALRGLAVPERQVLAWLQPERPELYAPDRFPVFNLAVEEGHFYGFPVWGVPGFKFGRYHHRGEVVDPETMDREPNAEDEALLRDFARRYFPTGAGPTMTLKTCLFTNTADEHFILDAHPDHPDVLIASGFSGHGFKFCSVIGEIMADLAQHGSTDHDITMFRLRRLLAAAEP